MSSGNKKKKNKGKNTKNNTNSQAIIYTADEVLSMMDETSQLLAQENFTRLASMGPGWRKWRVSKFRGILGLDES